MKLSYLLQPWLTNMASDMEIQGLSHDSRTVKPGDLFLAYPGALHDGRLYIEKALAAGAVGVLYEPMTEVKNPISSLGERVRENENPLSPLGERVRVRGNHQSCIPLQNLAQKTGELAARFYGNPGQYLSVTGVTGTNGKTTIAFLLTQAHNLLNQSARYMGTIGEGQPFALNELVNTTPDPLLIQTLFDQYHQAQVLRVCMEVSSHALCQHRVDAIAFEQAIFTNLTQDHLDYHQTIEDYAAAKSRLFMTTSLQWAIINADSPFSSMMAEKTPASCQILRYGLSKQAQVQALEWETRLAGTDLHVASPWGKHTFFAPMPGLFNVYNALAIFSSLLGSGYDPSEVVSIMPKLRASPGRMEVVCHEPTVIVDYAHTPDALENALKTIQAIKKGLLIAVFGCGGDRDKTKRAMMGETASRLADLTIVTSDNPRHEDPQRIIAEIVTGMIHKKPNYEIVDRKAAISQALSIAEKDDVILIAGKGHEAYQQIGDIKYPFSDQAVVRMLCTS